MEKKEKNFLIVVLILIPFYIMSVICYVKFPPHLPAGQAAAYASNMFFFILIIILLQINGMFFFKKK